MPINQAATDYLWHRSIQAVHPREYGNDRRITGSDDRRLTPSLFFDPNSTQQLHDFWYACLYARNDNFTWMYHEKYPAYNMAVDRCRPWFDVDWKVVRICE